jgi:hypothetical protein
MKQLIIRIKIQKEKFSDLKMIYRSLKLSSHLSDNDIKFSILEDLKNRRSKLIVAEWYNGMKLYEVWDRNIIDAIGKSIEALADDYSFELRTVNTVAEMRTNAGAEVTGA